MKAIKVMAAIDNGQLHLDEPLNLKHKEMQGEKLMPIQYLFDENLVIGKGQSGAEGIGIW